MRRDDASEPVRADMVQVMPLCIDVESAAAAIGVSGSVLRGLIADGRLPVVKFPSTRRPGEQSRRVLVSVDDLRAFVVAHREVAGG